MIISKLNRFNKVKAKDLSEGLVYVNSQGGLYLYLGKVKESYVFYYAGVLPLVGGEDSGSIVIYAESQACDCYFNLVNRLVMMKNKDAVTVRRTMPEFIGVYRGVNYVSYVEELRVCLGVENMTSEFELVTDKSLKIGELYVSAVAEFSEYSDVYQYLGKGANGAYLWGYMGSVKENLNGGGRVYHRYTTRSIKKITRLAARAKGLSK